MCLKNGTGQEVEANNWEKDAKNGWNHQYCSGNWLSTGSLFLFPSISSLACSGSQKLEQTVQQTPQKRRPRTLTQGPECMFNDVHQTSKLQESWKYIYFIKQAELLQVLQLGIKAREEIEEEFFLVFMA